MKIKRVSLRQPRGTEAWGRIPDDAEVIHTHLAGGTGPLHIYYGIKEDE